VGHGVRDDQRHRGERHDAGHHVGGVNTLGGTGTLAGAAIGALFLGFIANALILVGLSQFWLQAIYGLVILVAIGSDQIIRRNVQRANTRSGAR
jgi:ribose/xylose/arabinose/galactoside ABC-type transport system permease subunit